MSKERTNRLLNTTFFGGCPKEDEEEADRKNILSYGLGFLSNCFTHRNMDRKIEKILKPYCFQPCP